MNCFSITLLSTYLNFWKAHPNDPERFVFFMYLLFRTLTFFTPLSSIHRKISFRLACWVLQISAVKCFDGKRQAIITIFPTFETFPTLKIIQNDADTGTKIEPVGMTLRFVSMRRSHLRISNYRAENQCSHVLCPASSLSFFLFFFLLVHTY